MMNNAPHQSPHPKPSVDALLCSLTQLGVSFGVDGRDLIVLQSTLSGGNHTVSRTRDLVLEQLKSHFNIVQTNDSSLLKPGPERLVASLRSLGVQIEQLNGSVRISSESITGGHFTRQGLIDGIIHNLRQYFEIEMVK